MFMLARRLPTPFFLLGLGLGLEDFGKLVGIVDPLFGSWDWLGVVATDDAEHGGNVGGQEAMISPAYVSS
jgi:hypothetical protein